MTISRNTICFFNTTRSWGGGEKWHFEMSHQLHLRGYEVMVIARPHGELHQRSGQHGLTVAGFSVHNLDMMNPLKILRLSAILKRNRVGTLIINGSNDLKLAGLAGRLSGVQRIIYRRGSAIPVKNTWLNRWIFRHLLDDIIANSYQTATTVLENNPQLFPKEKIHVIYNGMDLSQFDRLTANPVYSRKEGEVVIGHAGRLVRQKGQHHLVGVALMLKQKQINFKMLIAGEGKLEEALRNEAIEKGLEKEIIFTGFLKNIKDLMEASDIFVLPSLWEGFGYVLTEAMACRKPVVAFDVSSNPEIVAEGETGYLVPRFDLESFAEKLEILISNPQLRKSLGEAGRLRVEKHFSLKKAVHDLIKLLQPSSSSAAVFEFHISGAVRKKYGLSESLFGTNGQVVFVHNRAVREFVHAINQDREPEQHLYPGEVFAAGLIDEICHMMLRRYEEEVNPEVFAKLQESLLGSPMADDIQKLLHDFTVKFPPGAVISGKAAPGQYLSVSTEGRSNFSISLEEILLLHLDAINPANKKMTEFFDPAQFDRPGIFENYILEAERFFKKQPPFGPDMQDVISFLKAPMRASPDDLSGQLAYIRDHWKAFLPDAVISLILSGQDLMKEDVMLEGFWGGKTPTMAPDYSGTSEEAAMFRLGKSGYQYALDAFRDYEEYEAFTSDSDWMPRVVMLAKNTWVWLHQLSIKYRREIRRLDQVPDEELDQLARWNINGLWLIGVWERSTASRRIKHIMGNIDAVSSAYSLYDYEIAHDLGGEEAYHNLNHRARARGIRLAGDMVPNHTGIYSRWVVERPHYFIQSSHPPFPAYRFTGEDLCPEPHIQIRIDDGYYNHSDAAVVFQRIDNNSGEIRYIYHGNDGTMMPWNDTAQLDFLKQEVREAVIQKIFEVARKFSIIRFDAAMTLAKKHFSRLWYPVPGSGGDIASRADYAMPQQQFDELFPNEFWREVVDRMNAEMPDTLLLAEAFWFMEGYFVRTLGMHRVYNSAFMHMLKNEDNEKYRDLITNTLEFEPEILKRYVNFMSNPDEETAINQFGTGDKYFGVCVLMNTLPGLPMFGHGQVEGYTEKYGMEYQRAYYEETPQQWLVEKHEREVFPLLAKRTIFSEVIHFNCFDYIDDHGHLNENVIAFTNMAGHEKALVLFNNKYESTSGKIMHSAPKLYKHEGLTKSITLAQALQIHPTENHFYIVREHIAGLDYLFTGADIDRNGFHWRLQGFEYRVFWQFREAHDRHGEYRDLHHRLGGRGVPDMEQAMTNMRVSQIRETFKKHFGDTVWTHIEALIQTISESCNEGFERVTNENQPSLPQAQSLTDAPEPLETLPDPVINDCIKALKTIANKLDAYLMADDANAMKAHSADILSKDALLARILLLPGADEESIFSPKQDTTRKEGPQHSPLFDHALVQDYLGVNEYQGVWYFHKESFEELMGWLLLIHLHRLTGEHEASSQEAGAPVSRYQLLMHAAKQSGYRWPLHSLL